MAIQFEDFKSVLEGVQVYERYMAALCPFHSDSHPSLLVFKDGWFTCRACNKRGTWKTLWNKANGLNVQIRPDTKVNWRGPDLEGLDPHELAYRAYDDMQNFESLAWYLEMRGLENRIEQQMLGYWNGWYTIPMFNENREFLNVAFRAAPHVQQATDMRYWCKGNAVLYVPDWKLVLDNKYLVITYGLLDALTLTELRIPAASPSNGQLSMKTEWLDNLRKVVYIIPDQDEEEAARRHAKELGWRGNVVLMDWHDHCKDINDLYRHDRKELEAQLNERIE